MDKVKVAVRVRPMNKRELELGTQSIITVDSKQIIVNNLANSKEGRKSNKVFAFDYCFDSQSPDVSNFATQEIVYNCLGLDIINNSFNGYNSCIFAYGQTGSGKSYTMTGAIDNKGLIPRICEGLFENINKNDENLVKIEVSYMEIYNEKVLDLLDPSGLKHNLKVREHKLLGPYVDGLSQLAVSSYKDIEVLINEGNKSRTVAATNMNSESSRSHAVFCLKINQTITDAQTGISGEKVSKLSLVDLAGSEKVSKTGVEGERLKEGCNINKSLHTLGLVISALADNTNNTNKANKSKHIPYRDSVLTWLLKDSLGGNSRTVMVAAISPAFDNYEETMSTLRYADRAKRIVNHAVVNEDPNAKLIRELREEIEALKMQLEQYSSASRTNNSELVEKLNETEKIYKEVSKPWDEKLAESEQIQREWRQTLDKLGISVQSSGIKVEKDKFYLVNMSPDPSMNELLVYYLKESTIVGKIDSNMNLDIQLSGPGIADEHCIFEIKDNQVYLSPLSQSSKTRVNGTLIKKETLLKHDDRIVIGVNHYFRIKCPNRNKTIQLQQTYDEKEDENENLNESNSKFDDDNDGDNGSYVDDIDSSEEQFDYLNAQQEVLFNDDESTLFRNAFEMYQFNNIDQQTNLFVEKNQFKIAFTRLQEQLLRANTLVNEANVLSKEMNKQTLFSVTLQISSSNLKLNRKKDILLFEPAILVKRSNEKQFHKQIWSLEKFENRIVNMREMYREKQTRGILMNNNEELNNHEDDPFFEALENHRLIGVANLFLDSLFYDCVFDYSLPIINQQGEISGYLKVQLKKDKHYSHENTFDDMQSSNNSQIDTNSEASEDLDKTNGSSSNAGSGNGGANVQMQQKIIKCILTIKEAVGLPVSLSNFVFCQYKFWNESEEVCVAPEQCDENFVFKDKNLNFLNGITIKFNQKREHIVKINEEFVDYCADGSLEIQVFGHHNIIDDERRPSEKHSSFNSEFFLKHANLIESWQQVRKSFELWIDIFELDKTGQWIKVNVKQQKENHTGGIYQLKQGQSKRIQIRIEKEKSKFRDLLPLYIDDVELVEIGSIQTYNLNQHSANLDSYQEIDLNNIREKWLFYLDKRKSYLNTHVKYLMEKQDSDKSIIDIEREKYLYNELIDIAEERNLIYAPPENSHLPGSLLTWKPTDGMEENIPIVFLNNNETLNGDTASSYNDSEEDEDDSERFVFGNNCLLTNETSNDSFYQLQFINKLNDNITNNIQLTCAWDSTIHDHVALNQLTQSDNFIYLIIKIKIKLTQPFETSIYIRKRICVQIYDNSIITANENKGVFKRSLRSFFSNVTSNLTGSALSLLNPVLEPFQQQTQQQQSSTTSTGVTYYIISTIPKCLEDYEQRDNLAIMSALTSEQDEQQQQQQEVPNQQILTINTRKNTIEKFLERYLNCIKSVDSLLRIDKKQQELVLQQAIRNEQQRQTNDSLRSSKSSNIGLSSTNLAAAGAVSFSNMKRTASNSSLNKKTTSVPNLLNMKNLKFGSTQNISQKLSLMQQPTPSKSSVTPTIINQQQPKIIKSSQQQQQEPVIKSPLNKAYNSNSSNNNLLNKLNRFAKPPQLGLSLSPTSINIDTPKPGKIVDSNLQANETSKSIEKKIESKINEVTIKPTETTQLVRQLNTTTSDKTDAANNTSNLPEIKVQRDEKEKNIIKDQEESTTILHTSSTLSTSLANQPLFESFDNLNLSNIEKSNLKIDNDSLSNSSLSQSASQTSLANDQERANMPEWIKEGVHVIVTTNTVLNKPGIIRYIGETKFQKGIWIGVELERTFGLNDGSVKNHRYFQCEQNKGVFVKADKLTINKNYYSTSS